MTAALLANHVWQSTIVAGVAWLITIALRRNRASVRHTVWLAASLKFLVPFALLVNLGSQFEWRTKQVPAPQPIVYVMDAIGQPFSPSVIQSKTKTPLAAARAARGGPVVAFAVWLVGCAAVLFAWGAGWRRVNATVRRGTPMGQGPIVERLRHLERSAGVGTPIALVSTADSLEPGVFGIAAPVLLWPRKISGFLDDSQIEAILVHEVSHVRRRDNLWAAAHMVVQAAFWFHPLVWLMGSRLADERERACDEEVVRLGSEPRAYAESILRVSRLYAESPLACVAGVTGSDLKTRIEQIMRNDYGTALSAWKRVLLTTTVAAAVAVPVTFGLLSPSARAQAPPTSADDPEAAIRKEVDSRGGGAATIRQKRQELEGLFQTFEKAVRATQASRAQQPAADDPPPAFDVSSVKPNKSGSGTISMLPAANGGWSATNVTLAGLGGRDVSLRAQSAITDAAKLPSFEVASVKPNTSGDGRALMMPQPGGRLNLVNVPLRLLIRNAYRVQDFQIAGGPDWLGTARFDIVAKAENGNPSPDDLQLMMQSLLADRFKLVVRSEKREMPVYALVPVRSDSRLGMQLRKSETDCSSPSASPAAPPPPGQMPRCGFMVGFGNLKARGITLPALAGTLSTFAGRIVLDRTGITGGYDVDLTWTPDQLPRAQGDQPPQVNGTTIDPNGPSLFTALQEQLGLKLESTKGPVDVLVVDRAERPTED